jgi:nucleoid-associated protein YgaU
LNRSIKNTIHAFGLALLFTLLPLSTLFSQENEEETYAISLVQTAEVSKEIHQVDNKKVLTELYTVKKGDHIWQLFRERGLLQKRNLGQLLAVLKKLNQSLTNLDLIYPGEKIAIPLTIAPVKGLSGLAQAGLETAIPLEALKDIQLENYTVKKGDSLIKVVRERYDVPEENIYGKYLQIVRRLNPDIVDLDFIYPGQIVRLPIYSPQIVRLPITPETTPKGIGEELTEDLAALSHQLMEIFSLIGEEWVNTGDHFIPLKSGGQINLKAESFPILNLSDGSRVIVDLSNDLPEKMAQLITSSWNNYRIVHLEEGEDLRGALAKTLPVCDYHKIYNDGEALELGGDIRIRMTADWIIKLAPDEKGEMILLTLADHHTPRTPREIKDFLETLGIRAIEYPPTDEPKREPLERTEILKAGHETSDLVEMVLNITGRDFTREVEIPLYQGEKTDYNLIVTADLLLNIDGGDFIIDFTGLGDEIISVLRDQHFHVLSLSGEDNPSSIVSKTLKFTGVAFDAKPHPFMAAARDPSKNISMTIPGIVFRDNHGQNVFASHLTLPQEIAGFLSRRGYKVLSLPLS